MTGRVSRSKSVRALTVLTALGLVSVCTGVGSAATGGDVNTAKPGERVSARTVTGTCAFGAALGSQQVSLETSAVLPPTITLGAPTKITSFSMKFTLPRGVVGLLPAPRGSTTPPTMSQSPPPSDTPSSTVLSTTPAGPAATTAPNTEPTALSGGLEVDLVAVQNGKQQHIPVPLTIASTAIPATGDIAVRATGEVPRFVMNAVGVTEFALSGPTLALASGETAATNDGTPATRISCPLDAGQNTVLGAAAAIPAASGKSATNALGADPPPIGPPVAVLSIVKVVTKAEVVRLGAKTTTKPTMLLNGLVSIYGVNEDALIAVGGVKVPPTQVTFLGFGFVPVTATAEFLPVAEGASLIPFSAIVTNGNATSHIEVNARLSNVEINGVPLDVGPHCRTESPVKIDVEGPYDPFGIGTLSTDPNSPDPKYRGFVLPGFTGCGTTEPLSKIFTGMSSGDGNQAEVDTENLLPCLDPDHRVCQPPPATPARR
jgi:hypothetical protein